MKGWKTEWLGSVDIHEIPKKEFFLAKSWIWKTELKERLRGKVFWVKTLKGRERFMAMIGIVWI